MAVLTETQQDIQAMAAEFVERELLPVLDVLESGDLDTLKMLWGKIQEAGFTGLAFPEAHGGSGLDSLSYFLVLTEIAKHSAALATALSVHVSLIGMPLLNKGTPQQQDKYLAKVISGEMIGAFALTEANAGSDAGAGICRAEKTDAGYVLNGTKLFISNALVADVFMVTARTDANTPGPKGLTAFLVDRNTPGFTIHKGEEKMGLKGGDWGELEFTDCVIPEENRFGEEGHGFKVFMESLNIGRIGIGAVSLGIAEACLAASLKYTDERQQFGQKLNEFQATQFKLADMATELEAARHLVHHAARLKDAGQPYAKEASMAKLYASELANRSANQAVQLHGGYGYTTDFAVERYFRDARVMSLFEGTSEIQRVIIARQLIS
jgi:alkylation response protein AidB-like acyl-CoA dehydrogenase